MAKITDEDGNFITDENGHGIYDLAGITESWGGAVTPAGDTAKKAKFKRTSEGDV